MDTDTRTTALAADPLRSRLLAVLNEEQARSGQVSKEFIERTAAVFDLTIGDVYGVATFYHMLSTKPLGRHVIRVCKSLPCHLKNSAEVIDAVQAELGIQPGETTADGRFSLVLTNCIGACDHAPAMLLDQEIIGDLTPEKIKRVLQSCE